MDDQITEDYLTSYALDQQRDAGRSINRCGSCDHLWHGLPCSHRIPIGDGNMLCPCQGAAA